ncbi:DnaB-like helicase C-terminal domain-containing protein [Borreliella lanei]|uniref:Replicative DNA helicase n=1 Tax=Borreliella lanei TaxID=373540 RepID=A0A7X0DK10_9SPIR|nr:DnaB-like helicase C-terminal domain-containing protein [Borreliella lanei]MBB6208501.1 replicative DNA helicase [Borreliella lanei]
MVNRKFVIIGAWPSVGKTAFVLDMVNNICARQNQSVRFFTLEMSSKSIVKRLISLNSCIIEYHKPHKLSGKKTSSLAIINQFLKLSIFLFTLKHRIHELRAQAGQMKRIYDIQLIFIDYIGLIIPASE